MKLDLANNDTAMGFDVGTKRIGVAIGNSVSCAARALTVVEVQKSKPDWRAINRLYMEWRPGAFIVGDPMTLSGGEQPARRFAKLFARALHTRYQIPVMLVDERSSTVEAEQRFAVARARGQRRRRDAVHLDAVAAAVIIERWMISPQDALLLE